MAMHKEKISRPEQANLEIMRWLFRHTGCKPGSIYTQISVNCEDGQVFLIEIESSLSNDSKEAMEVPDGK